MKKSDFERIIEKHFLDLEARYGFKKVETAFHTGGAMVRFQNPSTEVILNYEIGETPWITIADITAPKTARTSLDWLLVELGQKKPPSVDEAFLPAKLDESQVEASIQTQCDLLIRYGKDLLTGNFNMLPRLQKRADDYLNECKKFAEKHRIKE